MNISERIREARKSAKMTQQELADKLGVSYTLISQYERGLRNPKVETLQRIADALCIPLRETVTDLEKDLHFTPSDYSFLDILQFLVCVWKGRIHAIEMQRDGFPISQIPCPIPTKKALKAIISKLEEIDCWTNTAATEGEKIE